MEPTASPPLVRLERTPGDTGGHVADVVLDRPQALNAISTALARALGDVFTELAADDEVRAVFVLSSSPRAFCVGADLKERAATATSSCAPSAWSTAGWPRRSSGARCPSSRPSRGTPWVAASSWPCSATSSWPTRPPWWGCRRCPSA